MIYTHAAAAVLALAIGLAGGWLTRGWKAGNDERNAIEQAAHDARRRVERADQAAGKFEDKRAATAVRWRTVEKEVERVVEKPVYRNVCLDPDGLRILADEIDRNPHSGEPAPAMPAASEAGGR